MIQKSNGGNGQAVLDDLRHASPERALWQAVLLRAVEDALFGPAGIQGKNTRARIGQETRDYLTHPSDDLATVCDLAGLNMDVVIDRMCLLFTQSK